MHYFGSVVKIAIFYSAPVILYASYFATESRANCFVRLVLNDVRQTETLIHFKQNGNQQKAVGIAFASLISGGTKILSWESLILTK
jgi:hypothetical protein